MVPRRADWPLRIALGTGVIVSAYSVAILIAWQAHWVALIQLSPGLPPLTRQGAAALLLNGGALAFLAAGYRRVALVCAVVAGVLALLVGYEYLFNRDLGWDQLLGRGYIVASGAPPGRISPLAAVCYLGLSMALVAMARGQPARYLSSIAGIIASVLIAVSGVVLVTYLLRHPFAYSWGHFRRISPQAAGALVLLGTGTMALALRESRSGKALAHWLPAGLALGFSAGSVGVWQALLKHEESDFPLITHIILAAGILAAALVAAAVYLAQKATLRSRELQEGKAELERLFEASLEALLVTDRNGIIVSANQRVQALFGYTRDEVLGACIDTLVPIELRRLHEMHREGYYSDPVARPMGRGVDLRGLRKDGSQFQAEVSLSPLRLGEKQRVLASVRDVTENKQAQEALRRSEEQFRGVFEQGPIGLTLMGRDYHFVKVNAALCRMLGYSEAEMLAMTPLQFTHPDDLDPTVNMVERLFDTQAPVSKMEKRYVRKSGEVIWGSLNVSVIHDQEGRPLYGMGMIEDITDRKRAEEELRTVNQRLSLATRSASMGVWEYDLGAGTAIWDDRMFRIFGIPPKPLVYREDWEPCFRPDDLAKVEAFIANVAGGKTQNAIEYQITRPDGSLRSISVTGGPLLDNSGKVAGMVGIAIDITERKRAEEELQALNQRLSLATRSAFLGVWEWKRETGLAIWDDRMFEIFGIPKRPSVTRDDWAQRFHPGDLPIVGAFLEAVMREGTQRTSEARIIQPDGSLRYVSVAGTAAYDENGNVTGVVGVAQDITERKQMQLALEASSRLSALGMMAGGVAHEINNPLSVIHAMASDLVESVATEGLAPVDIVARKAAIIRETAERIARIVKSLRQISREGSGDMFHPSSLAKIITETLEICRAKFKANSVELLLPDGIPDVTILCREVQIEQALLNLLQNAFDAVVEQHGERWVRLAVEPGRDSVVVSVLDSGPGIPRELRSRLMEPFFTTKPVGKGTGLGLSLSKTIAEDHGGRLEYNEDHGRTRFSLVLPVAGKAEAA